MAQYTGFLGHTDFWVFVFFPASGDLTFDAGSSNSTTLIYTHSNGTTTRINGTGLSVGGTGAINWTTLSSVEHLAADNSVIERIDNLGTTGSTPGSSFPNQLADTLLSGPNTITGSAANDILGGGNSNDVFFGGAGADILRGSYGEDLFRLTAGGGRPQNERPCLSRRRCQSLEHASRDALGSGPVSRAPKSIASGRLLIALS